MINRVRNITLVGRALAVKIAEQMRFTLEILIIVDMEHVLLGQWVGSVLSKYDCVANGMSLQVRLPRVASEIYCLDSQVISGKLLKLSSLIVFCNNNNN